MRVENSWFKCQKEGEPGHKNRAKEAHAVQYKPGRV